jgi:HSP20 family molecular chaperone IbpA
MNGYCNGINFDATIEDIVRAAREFGQRMKDMGQDVAQEAGFYGFESRFEKIFNRGPAGRCFHSNFYFYPPVNIFEARDGSLVLEFALSGFEETGISMEFLGDHLVLSAKAAAGASAEDGGEYYRRGFRPRDIERQKYSVPAEDYAQDQAKATFKNGILTVVVPAKESRQEGIKVTIEKEGA